MTFSPKSHQHDIKSALKFFLNGKLKQARDICQKVYRENAGNTEAAYLLGIIEDTDGNHERAIEFLGKAVKDQPASAKYHYSLGIAYKNLSLSDEAKASFEKSIKLNPSFAEAHLNLGNILNGLGRPDEAIQNYLRAIQIKPGLAAAHSNLGSAYIKTGELNKGIASYKKFLKLRPDHVEILCRLGETYRIKGRYPEAIGIFKRVLAVKPDHARAYFDLGNVYFDSLSLGMAVSAFQNALSINPEYYEAHYNLGNTYISLGQADEAIIHLRKALSIKPNYLEAHSNLLLLLNYQTDVSQEYIYKEALNWQDGQTKNRSLKEFVHTHTFKKNHKLKIGYVSPDFRNHPVSSLFEPFLKARKRDLFEVFCYSNVKKPDEITERIKMEADHWSSIAEKKAEDAADEIRRNEIDILVDLAGHTADHSLQVFMNKPAPIQVSWLGYPNTTGLEAMDYRFTDQVADPAGKVDPFYSEELIRLKYGFFCYQPQDSAPEVRVLPCLEQGYVTFGSFNNLTKITPAVVKAWSAILKQADTARLLLKSMFLADKATRAGYLQLFADEGIPEERLELVPMLQKKEDHLKLYGRIDIGLDPFPYNGTTTTCEAMWMGVPVITMLGDRHSGRVGAGIMHRTRLLELIAENEQEYVDKAVSLAKDTDRLSALRSGMRNRMLQSPLCNIKKFTGSVEEAYLTMWKKYVTRVNANQ